MAGSRPLLHPGSNRLFWGWRMLATVSSATLVGVDGHPVSVEVHVSNGLPGFRVVGLPDASCREARDRVRAALISSGFAWPQKRITVNLAPSGLRKAGSGLDLAVALGVLAADGQIARRGARRRRPSSPSWAWTGRCDGSRASCPWWPPRPSPAWWSRRRAGAKRAWCRGHGSGRPPHLRALVLALRGQAPWPDLPPAAGGQDAPAGSRPGRGAGPAVRSPGPGGGRGRGSPPADGRPGGGGQDDAGDAVAGPAAAAQLGGSARGGEDPLRRRAGRASPGCACARRSARRITARRRCRSSAAEAPGCGPGKSAAPTEKLDYDL